MSISFYMTIIKAWEFRAQTGLRGQFIPRSEDYGLIKPADEWFGWLRRLLTLNWGPSANISLGTLAPMGCRSRVKRVSGDFATRVADRCVTGFMGVIGFNRKLKQCYSKVRINER